MFVFDRVFGSLSLKHKNTRQLIPNENYQFQQLIYLIHRRIQQHRIARKNSNGKHQYPN